MRQDYHNYEEWVDRCICSSACVLRLHVEKRRNPSVSLCLIHRDLTTPPHSLFLAMRIPFAVVCSIQRRFRSFPHLSYSVYSSSLAVSFPSSSSSPRPLSSCFSSSTPFSNRFQSISFTTSSTPIFPYPSSTFLPVLRSP